MKYSLKRALCFVIVVAMLLCAVPIALADDVIAEDGMEVLKSISNSAIVSTVNVSGVGSDITLTVPYSYSGSTINLDNSNCGYNTGFTDVVASFSEDASIDGSAVKLTVAYTVSADTSGARYKTEYNVLVVKAAKVSPTFSGKITKNVSVGESVSLTYSDFTGRYKKNDGNELAGIKIEGSNPRGKFMVSGTEYDLGTMIPVNKLASLTFAATSAGSVTYSAVAYDDVSGSPIGGITITITVTDPVTPTASQISYTVKSGSTVKFDSGKFVSAISGLASDDAVSYIKFKSLASKGTLYYNYTSTSSTGTAVNTTTSYYIAKSPLISDITYVASGTTGDDTNISYTAYTTKGKEISGTVKVTVSANTASSITYSTTSGTPVKFSITDFNNVCNAVTGRNLNYLQFTTIPSTAYGNLYYNYSSVISKGTRISSSSTSLYYSGSPLLSTVAFIPTTTTTTRTITIPYTAYAEGGSHYTGSVVVTVSKKSGNSVEYDCKKNGSVSFKAADFKYGSTAPSYIIIDDIPSSSEGYLYHGSTSSTSNRITSSDEGKTKYYYSSSNSKYISNIKFVPKTSFTGDVEIPFTAYDSSKDELYSGTIDIEVGSSSSSSGDVDTIEYEVAANDYVTFTTNDFNKVCKDEYDVNLDYIKFELPDKDEGKLYYKYSTSSESSVTESKKYYRSSSPQIGDISFVPDEDFDGTVTISYTGMTTDDDEFDGEIEIEVEESDDSIINYSVSNGSSVKFKSADFDDASNSINDEDLSYIKLKSVSSSYGKLYYNYSSSSTNNTAASTSTSYYVSGSGKSLISNLSFVPSTTASTTVSFKFTGYDKDGETFDGTIKIKINGNGDGEDDDDVISYTVANNSTLKLNASDFNTMSKALNDETLDYVKFTLPSTTYGTLYLNYSSASSPGTKVTSSTSYYRSGTPSLGNITFVPTSTYTGTFYINFAGHDEEGDTFSGTIKVKVTSGTTNTTASTISYKTDNGTTVPFVANDFNTACYSATNKTLSYVVFKLPNTSYGTLYSNYVSATSKGTAVTASSKYYYTSSTPLVSSVTFVPNESYTGTVIVNYTGYATDGTTYTGTVTISISDDGNNSASSYFKDVGTSLAWAADGIDYLYEKGIVTGTSTGVYSPANNIKRGDFILMLQRAFKFTANTGETQFGDVASTSYYASAILAAKSKGIAQGGGDNKFRPEGTLTREDAMVLVSRALTAADQALPAGTASDIASFTDKGSVSSYATTAVATLVKSGYITGSGGKLNPKSNITRAEMAVLLYRIVSD